VDVRRAVVALAVSLVETESVNPGLAAGSGERAAAEVVAAWADAAGLDVELEEALPGRPNVLVTAGGTGGGRTLLLNGHLDTVGVAGMDEPFEASVRDGRLFGRGAYDMKGALAAALIAAAKAREERLPGNVVVACVIDEELASAGTERLLRGLTADGAIVCEPTDERVCIAHKGFAGFEIETAGRAAHGSRHRHLTLRACGRGVIRACPDLALAELLEPSQVLRSSSVAGPGLHYVRARRRTETRTYSCGAGGAPTTTGRCRSVRRRSRRSAGR
jgi:acetylornithine deacetylase/succinyl-diaminopimelate desuccinylase-like protein